MLALAASAFAAVAAGPGAGGDEVRAVQDLLARGQAQAALERLQAREGNGTAPATPSNGTASSIDAELRFLHGVALMDLQRDAQALAWFERMTQDHPELPDPFNNIALLHVRAGRLEPARQALETALRNDPSYRVARANLGLVHLMLAVQAWEQVVAGGPAEPQLLRRLEGARALLAGAPLPR
ncbi:MAG: tetratricopeptide repeat protein [Rubrivivax sp.]|nr:tetratricopeptide repeat protein [Rubrivivax sp.]